MPGARRCGGGARAARAGQSMVETMLAVIFVSFVLFFSFRIVRMVTAKILLDHAAARAARARAIGYNDFMCRKAARTAMIPAAGRRTWPADADFEEGFDEAARIRNYLASRSESVARGILNYEWWPHTGVDVDASSFGVAPVVEAAVDLDTDEFHLQGGAEIESHYQLYMNDWN